MRRLLRPLVRPLLLAALLLGAAGLNPAAAQIREGFYAVEGANPDGTAYAGLLSLQPGPGASWLAVWRVGDVRIAGLAVVQAGVLAISFVVEGRPGIAAYEVQADGTLRGVWSTGGGMGTESLTPRDPPQ